MFLTYWRFHEYGTIPCDYLFDSDTLEFWEGGVEALGVRLGDAMGTGAGMVGGGGGAQSGGSRSVSARLERQGQARLEPTNAGVASSMRIP